MRNHIKQATNTFKESGVGPFCQLLRPQAPIQDAEGGDATLLLNLQKTASCLCPEKDRKIYENIRYVSPSLTFWSESVSFLIQSLLIFQPIWTVIIAFSELFMAFWQANTARLHCSQHINTCASVTRLQCLMAVGLITVWRFCISSTNLHRCSCNTKAYSSFFANLCKQSSWTIKCLFWTVFWFLKCLLQFWFACF